MVDTERSPFRRRVSVYFDGKFRFIKDLFRQSASKEISSQSVALYKHRCTHIKSRVKSLLALANNKTLVHNRAKKLEDFAQNGAEHNNNKPHGEYQLNDPNELGSSRVKILVLWRDTLSLAALKAGLAPPFTWKHAFIPKTSPLRQLNPDQSMPCMDGSRLYAVLIGINAYESYPLRGCVSDALAVRKYLTDDLHVPKERIRCLFGPGSDCQVNSSIPSRNNIIATLLDLVQDPHIQPGDGIIIYFSGHGTSYQCSHCHDSIFTGEAPERACLKSLCPIEALCPIDRDTRDNDNDPLPDISDREFNAILTHIYRAKGNRITVILDCCHNANLNRSMIDEGARALPPLPRTSFDRMLHSADQNMRRFPLYHSILNEDWLPNMDSHVVLAACGEYQLTTERREGSGIHGVFTQSLLRTLRSGRLTKHATYTDLIDVLPWSYFQAPVVAGKRKYTRLWYQD
ncbi:caspase domain-containing protein [Armillaria luteobubalina]|uniref:Caspase domain-containing protein n=1 Tax=Armillaria luteobubalina TaxID=153913 RepID=A0AA39NUV6_9AGAR|nr:caspase domain-containing protein [Armillaria luteobubalina]